jgi:hypothetical protein
MVHQVGSASIDVKSGFSELADFATTRTARLIVHRANCHSSVRDPQMFQRSGSNMTGIRVPNMYMDHKHVLYLCKKKKKKKKNVKSWGSFCKNESMNFGIAGTFFAICHKENPNWILSCGKVLWI